MIDGGVDRVERSCTTRLPGLPALPCRKSSPVRGCARFCGCIVHLACESRRFKDLFPSNTATGYMDACIRVTVAPDLIAVYDAETWEVLLESFG